MRRSKALLAAALAAAALVPVGAAPAHAMAVCQAKVLGQHSEWGQLVLIAGVYKGPADAVEIQLTCGVVRNGGTVARSTDRLVGPVAAVADVQAVYGWGLTACHEIRITHLDGSVSFDDTCP